MLNKGQSQEAYTYFLKKAIWKKKKEAKYAK